MVEVEADILASCYQQASGVYYREGTRRIENGEYLKGG